MASAKTCPECIAPPYGVVCFLFSMSMIYRSNYAPKLICMLTTQLCICMIIGSRYRLKTSNELSLFKDNTGNENVESQKLLKIHIDNKLTWDTHIDKVCKNLVPKLFLLKRIQFFLTPEMKQLFYNTHL